MFRSAYLRLTLWYLAIIMLISILFSITLYGVLTNELGRGLRRQALFYRGLPIIRNLDGDSGIEQIQNQITESSRRVELNLVYFNIIILVLAGGASYFLAQRTLKPIKEALDSQSRFTADASHELRTPLTAMKTEIEVALREKSLPITEAKTVLTSTLEEIGKLEDLSNALLVLSSVQNGTSKKGFEEISLDKVVAEAVAAIQSFAKAKKIKITTEVEPVKLEADTAGLVSLTKILLDNAIKYSRVESEVKVLGQPTDGQVLLAISDQGIGIKEDELPHIFERFYRADTSRSSQNVAGYGLGLAIAKKIVDNHHGKIEVESTPDKGSTFNVHLPTKQTDNNLLGF